MLVIGLMSGTSADAVDAALVAWPDGEQAQPFELLAFCELPLGEELQARIHRLAAGRVPGPDALAELARLDVELGERFAEAARAVADRAGQDLARIDVIASHGQTVAHHPEHRTTLQIGAPSVIAERTGCTTIANFRVRDIAAGGEGAPLAPFFHWAVMGDPTECRLVLNLGGIANVTWLPAAATARQVVAFDVGPANSLMDGIVSLASDGAERFDRDGRRARRGNVDERLLQELLADSYLRRPPPKSTGRERYGLAEAEALWAQCQEGGGNLDDLLATLVALVAQSVADAARDFLGAPRIDRLLVGGGGARNPALMAALEERGPAPNVEPFDAVGVPAAAAEAMAFSLMGRNARLGLQNHLPRTTGARSVRILGEVVPGS
ncbi:MAG: anhydro-N-acetylmuramic acid kinase [bacterium]|nr:anhydro-N-acetylmuramic acid kinase [bacterium]MCP5065530.1 anhydro-N-acetylmuramic acid kinase [bacterium]